MKKQPSKVDKQEFKEHHLEVGDSDGSSKEDGEDPLSDISDVFDTETPPPPTDDVAKQPKKVLKKEDSRTAADALIDQQFAGLTDHTMDLADWPLFAEVSTCLVMYRSPLFVCCHCIYTPVHRHQILYRHLYTVTTSYASVHCHQFLYRHLYTVTTSYASLHCHHILCICTLSPNLVHCSLLRRNHREEDQEDAMERRRNCLSHLRTKKAVMTPMLLHLLLMKMTLSQLNTQWRQEKSVNMTTWLSHKTSPMSAKWRSTLTWASTVVGEGRRGSPS